MKLPAVILRHECIGGPYDGEFHDLLMGVAEMACDSGVYRVDRRLTRNGNPYFPYLRWEGTEEST